MAVPRPVPIFRLMHIENLSIGLRRGGLHAPNNIPSDGLKYKTIHNIDIQNERGAWHITCGPKGVIHDYVPFYFGMRSPMLFQLCTGLVEGYAEGQDPLIYVVSTVESIHGAALPFVFSDGHGIAAYTQWYDKLADLGKIDWEAVHARYWNCTVEDPDRQRRKQAEFLVYRFCPWELVHEIGVLNESARAKVISIISNYCASTPVQIHREWYY